MNLKFAWKVRGGILLEVREVKLKTVMLGGLRTLIIENMQSKQNHKFLEFNYTE